MSDKEITGFEIETAIYNCDWDKVTELAHAQADLLLSLRDHRREFFSLSMDEQNTLLPKDPKQRAYKDCCAFIELKSRQQLDLLALDISFRDLRAAIYNGCHQRVDKSISEIKEHLTEHIKTAACKNDQPAGGLRGNFRHACFKMQRKLKIAPKSCHILAESCSATRRR